MSATDLSCNQQTASNRMPAEIADHGHDSPGGSLTFLNLSGGVESRHAERSGLSRKSSDGCTEGITDSLEAVKVRTRVIEAHQSGSSAPPTQNPLKLPDPWLFDSESLIREIDRIRETALQVPTNGDANATHFGLQQVVNTAWTLRENIRYILGLHRERQRAFGKQHKTGIDQQHQTIYVLVKTLLTRWGQP